jgi:hypothetical protein
MFFLSCQTKEKDMKTCIIAALICTLIASCKKSSIEGVNMISGKWELRQSAGGIAGTINYEPGNGTVYKFDINQGYQFTTTTNGFSRLGNYEIKPSANSGDWLLNLKYLLNSQTITETDSIRFDKNKLVFLPSASCCDMPTVVYERWQ